MVTNLQKKAAQAIVNVFETGSPFGDYGQVTILPGDSGHLTYGRSQTTLASGNLFLLVKSYCLEKPAAALCGYLERLRNRDFSLDFDVDLHRLLREAGEDPVMHEVQDRFFDRVYWEPSLRSAAFIGASTPLGVAVVYDSRIHGSWPALRNRTTERHGALQDIGEKAWIRHYVDERRAWLAHHPNTLLHRTVYRMDALRALVDEDNWDLDLPFHVRGVRIDAATLQAHPLRISAQDFDERLLYLQRPYLQGEDVRALQQALDAAGFGVDVDGVFGPRTEAAVKAYQHENGLVADGVVGPATRSMLLE